MTNFSQEWDECYRKNTQMSIWPWSDLVSYVMRYARPDSPKYRVLELGCGAGANIPFFSHLGVDYCAIEGSPSIVGKLWEKFPELKKQIVVGDFTKEIPFEGQFDLIFDRASLTHNSTKAIMQTIKLIKESLKLGSKFIGIDWFSTLHSDYNGGMKAEDNYTRCNYINGQFTNVGRVHFSDKGHLKELFSDFEIEVMELKTVHREIPQDNHTFAAWNLVARKAERND